MNIEEMKLEDIQTRKAEIKAELDTDLSLEEIEARTLEVSQLNERETAIKEKAEERKALLDSITNDDSLKVIATYEKEERKMDNEKIYETNTVEYRNMYFKNLLGKELDEVEKRTFVHTTSEEGLALPETTLNQIWSSIEEQHPIINDITMYRAKGNLKVQKHVAIVTGDAGKSTEGVKPTNEENTFVTVTLVAETFAKVVEVSYELDWAVPHLEAYLISEISQRLGKALADEIVAKIQSGMSADNKKTAVEVAYGDLTGLFGALQGAGRPVVYVNNATLYTHLVSLVDAQERPLFQPSLQAGVQGSLIGAQIKLEDSVPANVILVGDPKQVAGNMAKEIFVEQDKDIMRGVNQYAGRCQFGAELLNDKGFAQLTVGA